MLERAKEVTRNGKYTYIEYARFADDLVILIDAHRRHDWLLPAVENASGRKPMSPQTGTIVDRHLELNTAVSAREPETSRPLMLEHRFCLPWRRQRYEGRAFSETTAIIQLQWLPQRTKRPLQLA
jgi:hypothetical protein